MSKLLVPVSAPSELSLDAGTIVESADAYFISPPVRPLIEQLVDYLDQQPTDRYADFQTARLAVGLTALCVRWGSYLATLIDTTTELHPDLVTTSRKNGDVSAYSFITNQEMCRINIEVSYNLAYLTDQARQRDPYGPKGFYELLSKAQMYLPMPQQRIQRNKESGRCIRASLARELEDDQIRRPEMSASTNPKISGRSQQADLGSSGETDPLDRTDPFAHVETVSGATWRDTVTASAYQHPDRTLANILMSNAWRNTFIEDIHAGREAPHSLCPHQQRLTIWEQRSLFREVAGNLGAVLWLWDDLFNPDSVPLTSPAKLATWGLGPFPLWPDTAATLATSFYGLSCTGWSLTDHSAPVHLWK